ncbi:MAG: AAA family ATPase [Candidatus Sulfotelmatobacter sp.]
MVLDYYNLKEQPFGVTPDPRYLYPSPTHREALASLSYAIQTGRGFMSIIAEPGMGKTTILFQLLNELRGAARTVFLFQTLCSPNELLRALLRDLGVVDETGDVVHMQEQLNNLLLAEARQGRKVVVVIDEAQNLEDSALELVRMLSNFETTSDKLMQIVLSGQPQLREKLASPHLLQLRQRMSIFARLHPFSNEETSVYIHHRLHVAGYDFKVPLFTRRAEALIAQYSQGIPRNINNICFNAISLGYVLKQKSIREEVIRECMNDLGFETEKAVDGNAEAAEHRCIALAVPKSDPAFQLPFGWRRQVALCAMLLLFLLFCTGVHQGPEALRTRSPLVASAVSQIGLSAPTDRARSKSPARTGELGAKFVPVSSASETSVSPESVASTSAQKSEHSRPALEYIPDPEKLWEQVKNADSDAEIELARLYIEGTAVPQNCTQAQILLLAASRKGNARAADVLNNYSGQCR